MKLTTLALAALLVPLGCSKRSEEQIPMSKTVEPETAPSSAMTSSRRSR